MPWHALGTISAREDCHKERTFLRKKGPFYLVTRAKRITLFGELQRRLRRSQPGDRHPEGRAADVIHINNVRKFYRIWLTKMFAAAPDLKIRPRRAPFVDGHPHQPAHAFPVDDGKGVLRQDLLLDVLDQETLLGVVAGDAEGHLGQVVGAEGEELGHLGDLAGGQRGARDLDHRAELVVHLDALLGHHGLGLFLQGRLLDLQLVDDRGQRDHDLGMHVHAVLGAVTGRFEDRAHLHAGQRGEVDAQAHAAQAQHGVELVHALNGR